VGIGHSYLVVTRHFGFSQASELQKKLNGILPQPALGVVRWHYTYGTDWSGEPAIYFWVVLTDDASKKQNLRKATDEFTNVISRQVDFLNDWGLIPYFHFRSESEQEVLQDEVYK
jgi:hypothetical protein